MIISNCPRCHEGFRVPTGAIPEDAYAQCPWCRERFPISQLLESLPPAVQIVSADGTPVIVGEAASTGLQLIEPSGGQTNAGPTAPPNVPFSDTVDDGWHQQETFAQSGRSSVVSADDDPYSTWDQPNSPPIQSMNVATKSSPRKRKGSGIGTFIGIILGGLASVPIAGGLLMLLGRTPDWGFWPFNGEQHSSSTYAAAPLADRTPGSQPLSSTGTTLRFNDHPTGVGQTSDPATSAAQEIMNASLGEATGEENIDPVSSNDPASSIDSTPRDAEAGVPDASVPDASVPDASDADAASNRSTAGEPAEPESDQPVQIKIGDQTADGSASTPVEGGQGIEPSAEPSAAESAGTTASSQEVSEADSLAVRATQMIEVMSQYQGDAAEGSRRMEITYRTIANAAAMADQPSESLQSLADKIIASTIRDDIRSAGWAWLESEERPSDGVAVIGRVRVSDEGRFLDSESGGTVPLPSEMEVLDGQELLVLGQLIDEGKSLQVVHSQEIP